MIFAHSKPLQKHGNDTLQLVDLIDSYPNLSSSTFVLQYLHFINKLNIVHLDLSYWYIVYLLCLASWKNNLLQRNAKNGEENKNEEILILNGLETSDVDASTLM